MFESKYLSCPALKYIREEVSEIQKQHDNIESRISKIRIDLDEIKLETDKLKADVAKLKADFGRDEKCRIYAECMNKFEQDFKKSVLEDKYTRATILNYWDSYLELLSDDSNPNLLDQLRGNQDKLTNFKNFVDKYKIDDNYIKQYKSVINRCGFACVDEYENLSMREIKEKWGDHPVFRIYNDDDIPMKIIY